MNAVTEAWFGTRWSVSVADAEIRVNGTGTPR